MARCLFEMLGMEEAYDTATSCCGGGDGCSLPCCGGEGGGAMGFFIECMTSTEDGMRCLSKTFGSFASPLAFPCIYCFSPEDDGNHGREWDVRMEMGPCRKPHICCCSCILPCCTQWWVRRQVLENDMSRYKCCQGHMDGPYCCAVCKEGLPFTFEAGSYGESTCPDLCLCLEAWCCTYLAFQISRIVIREDRGLKKDPSEVRVDKCLDFFGSIAAALCCAGCCLQCCACCLCAAGQGDAADATSGLGGACMHMSGQIVEGMRWVMFIAMGCMSSQMMHEMGVSKGGKGPGGVQMASAPFQKRM